MIKIQTTKYFLNYFCDFFSYYTFPTKTVTTAKLLQDSFESILLFRLFDRCKEITFTSCPLDKTIQRYNFFRKNNSSMSFF